jgi:hypothetical protein
MFSTVLVAGEDFDLAIRTEDGSDQFTGMNITCCLKPPTGAQVDVPGVVSSGGSLVSFRVLGSSTASWPTGLWVAEFWSNNGAGSRDQLYPGTLRVVAPKVTVP